MGLNTGMLAYKLAFEKSPIFLTDGLAAAAPGSILPLISITEAADLIRAAAGNSIAASLDSYFATFFPMPGAKLMSAQLGKYPFANQKTAANALIVQALNFSMRMNVTPKLSGAMITRTMIMSALKAALDAHAALGGTYTVLTPSYMYVGCVLLEMTDITSGESLHQQTDWQLNFEQPLLNTTEATQTMNALMKKLSAQVQP
jgi:hypothetical protein